jgi:hypothetical protein
MLVVEMKKQNLDKNHPLLLSIFRPIFFADRIHRGRSEPCRSTCLLSLTSWNQPETDSPALHVPHVSCYDLSGFTHTFPSGCSRGESNMPVKKNTFRL